MARDRGEPWHLTAHTSWWDGTRTAWCGAVSGPRIETGWWIGTPSTGWCTACKAAKKRGTKPPKARH